MHTHTHIPYTRISKSVIWEKRARKTKSNLWHLFSVSSFIPSQTVWPCLGYVSSLFSSEFSHARNRFTPISHIIIKGTHRYRVCRIVDSHMTGVWPTLSPRLLGLLRRSRSNVYSNTNTHTLFIAPAAIYLWKFYRLHWNVIAYVGLVLSWLRRHSQRAAVPKETIFRAEFVCKQLEEVGTF